MSKKNRAMAGLKSIFLTIFICLAIAALVGLTYKLVKDRTTDDKPGTEIGGDTPGGENPDDNQGGEHKPDPDTPTLSDVYVIRFDPNGGNGEIIQITTQENGRLSDLAAEPVRDGYNFTGWYTATENGARIDTNYVFTVDTTVYAQWSALAAYKIKFDSNGGQMSEDDELFYYTGGDGILTAFPNAPTLDKYEFVGWFTERDGGEYVYKSFVFSSDTTIYAHWSRLSIYTVTFDANGGELADESDSLETQKTGRLGVLPSTPTRDKYAFTGWYTARENGTQIDTSYTFGGDTTVYAQWVRLSIWTVTFDPDGGTLSDGLSQLETADNGKLSSLPADPIREGYEFLGWYISAEATENIDTNYVFTADSTVYARWEKLHIYTVTFDPNGGTISHAPTAITAKNGKLASLPSAPTYAGYVFLGWFTQPSGGTQITTAYTFSSNTTIYAQWRSENCKLVTFEPNGGEAVYSAALYTQENGTLAAFPADPARTGYAFMGWFTAASEGTQVTTSTVFTEDTTVFAQWNKVYTITFDPNGGNGETVQLVTQADGTLSACPEAPTHPDNEFASWFILGYSSPTEFVSSSTVFTKDTTVIAVWKNCKFFGDFKGGGGKFPNGSSSSGFIYVGADSKFHYLPPDPIREGYTFLYWETKLNNSEGTGLIVDENGSPVMFKVTKDLIYNRIGYINAVYSENITTVTFDANGGVLTGETTATTSAGKLSSTVLDQAPTREGYEFLGWFTAAEGGELVTSGYVFPGGEATIYAQWNKINAYTITFDPNGGTLTDSSERLTSSSGTLSNMPSDPVRDGYNFIGWYTDSTAGTEVDGAFEFTSNATVYAQWRQQGTYAVTFDVNGGSMVSGNSQYTTSLNGKLSEFPTAYLNEDDQFIGWYTAREGGASVSSNYIFGSDTTLYAHYGVANSFAPGHNGYGIKVTGEDDYTPLDDFSTEELAAQGTQAFANSSKQVSFVFDSQYTAECFKTSYVINGGSDRTENESNYYESQGIYNLYFLASFTIENKNYPFDVISLSLGRGGKSTFVENIGEFRLSYSIVPYRSVGIEKNGSFVTGRLLFNPTATVDSSAITNLFHSSDFDIRVRTPYLLCDLGFYKGNPYSPLPDRLRRVYMAEKSDGSLVELDDYISETVDSYIRFGIDLDGKMYISSSDYTKMNFDRFILENDNDLYTCKALSYGRYVCDFGSGSVCAEGRTILKSKDLYLYFNNPDGLGRYSITFWYGTVFGGSDKIVFKVADDLL